MNSSERNEWVVIANKIYAYWRPSFAFPILLLVGMFGFLISELWSIYAVILGFYFYYIGKIGLHYVINDFKRPTLHIGLFTIVSISFVLFSMVFWRC